MLGYGVDIAALMMLSFSFSNLLGKKSTTTFGDFKATAVLTGASVIPLVIALLFFGAQQISALVLFFALGAGLLTAVGYVLIYKSLETEQVTNTIALSGLSPVVIFLFGLFVLGEGASRLELLGAAAVFIGLFLVSTKKGLRPNRKLLPALLGNVAWAFGYIAEVEAVGVSDQVYLPVFIAMLSSFVFVLVIASLWRTKSRRKAVRLAKRPIVASMAIGAGLFQGLGETLFGLSVLLQDLVIAGPIYALQPGIVAVVGHFAYKDRLTTLQLIGLAALVVGSIVLSLF